MDNLQWLFLGGGAEAINTIFQLGFAPDTNEFYELTPEQYQIFYASEKYQTYIASEQYLADKEHILDIKKEKVYMLLPNDDEKYAEFATGSVQVFGQSDIKNIRIAAEFIEDYCKKSKQKFETYHDKLKYCASVMPEVFSQDSIYAKE